MDVRLTTDRAAPEAFGGFWEAERPRLIRAVATTIGNVDAAAEAVDEAMARAWDRWHTVGGLDAPGGWVYRVAVNHARSRWRKLRREVSRAVVRNPSGQADASTDALAPLDDRLQEALLALDHDRRVVVVIRLLLDLSTAQTATVLDVPAGTVRSRLSRAVGELRTHLEVE